MSGSALILATELAGASGGPASAAMLAVSLAAGGEGGEQGAVFVEVGAAHRGPTILASAHARELERDLRDAGFDAVARGRLAWLSVADDDELGVRLGHCLDAASPAPVVVHAPAPAWRGLLDAGEPTATGALIAARLPGQRSLAALTVHELRTHGVRARIVSRPPGRISGRRALAGIEPGGEAGGRIARLARGLRPPALVSEAGQSLPLVLGGAFVLVFCALLLAAFGGAVAGKSRAQTLADAVALSAARSMRDDFDRLFVPARRADGGVNPAHLSKRAFLDRARAAALEAAVHNRVAARALEISFPDRASFAPLRVRIELAARFEPGAAERSIGVPVHAVAEAVPGGASQAGASAAASGGGYSGPLVYRNGEGMRPDVAAAFDRMAAAARAGGRALIVNSGFRSDEEQAALFAANPDPRWVAPPGTSLHRCATELDLGPPSAYGWLAANAERFGFVQRYPWEPWHFGYVDGPEPCSAAGEHAGLVGAGPGQATGSGDGGSGGAMLPSFVPTRYRGPILAAAARWNVSASLLAAQLMAESNFNPFAVSSAGARGIAQFMPATAAAYGLEDPFDAAAAINAQAQLMSDLLEQFGGQAELALAAYNAGPAPVAACECIPPYPETQAYVARILGLMGGTGAVAAPALEVRLVD